jgi:hypothetical protein
VLALICYGCSRQDAGYNQRSASDEKTAARAAQVIDQLLVTHGNVPSRSTAGIPKRVVQAARHGSDVSRERPRARGSLINGQTLLQQIDHRTSAGMSYFMKLRTSCEI